RERRPQGTVTTWLLLSRRYSDVAVTTTSLLAFRPNQKHVLGRAADVIEVVAAVKGAHGARGGRETAGEARAPAAHGRGAGDRRSQGRDAARWVAGYWRGTACGRGAWRGPGAGCSTTAITR